MTKFLFELTHEEQLKICNLHYHSTHCCRTCPLTIEVGICTLDISDDSTSLKEIVTNVLGIALKEIEINDYIRMDKTEVGDKGESGERK